MEGDKFFYRDAVSGKVRFTRGRFEGWTTPSGLLRARYAKFHTLKTYVFVPMYALTAESRQKLPNPEQEGATD